MDSRTSRTYSCQSLDSFCSTESDHNADSGVFEDGNVSPLESEFRSISSAHFEVNARNEFNKNRKIIIRNVPPVTYEVRDVIQSFILLRNTFSSEITMLALLSLTTF